MIDMPFGATPTENGTRFRLWAPSAESVVLVIDGVRHDTAVADGGWREVTVADARAGTAYAYEVDGMTVPDPASRCQQEDVHGPSLVVDPDAYQWKSADWKGRPWAEAVIEEVHVGTATPEGTFDGLRRRLEHYVRLGVTAIELLPVGDFSGKRNWGYDGVLLFAPDRAYGEPDDLRRLIDEAHGLGLQVFIDVVYNHFGPDGNYLGAYAKDFFDEEKHTPWGAALNFSRQEVRDFFVANAQAWLHEYRFDGIRFDAVHAISDMAKGEGQDHFLEEMAKILRSGVEEGRHVHLILENDDNASELLGGPPLYDAQWNDDFHHAVHRLITRETDGYYADYDEAPKRLARILGEGFAYQGEPSPHRDGAKRGTPSGGLPSTAFVSFIQNHDQVGNRALGDRIDEAAPDHAVRAATALYLLCPHIPMIWMGEEFAASSNFPFFCDFHGDLADAVRKGRREEFARFERFADPAMRELIPDPNAEETFLSAKIDWEEIGRHRHADRLDLFRTLISARHEHVVPLLKSGPAKTEAVERNGSIRASWAFPAGTLVMDVNLDHDPGHGFGARGGETIYETGKATDEALPAWYLGVSVA